MQIACRYASTFLVPEVAHILSFGRPLMIGRWYACPDGLNEALPPLNGFRASFCWLLPHTQHSYITRVVPCVMSPCALFGASPRLFYLLSDRTDSSFGGRMGPNWDIQRTPALAISHHCSDNMSTIWSGTAFERAIFLNWSVIICPDCLKNST